jgi:hypothetical protein
MNLLYKQQHFNVLFAIVPNDDIPLLDKKTCVRLGLVKRVYSLEAPEEEKQENIIEEYNDVFSGIGQFEKLYHIEVDPNVPTRVQQPRKVPFAKYNKLKETLDDLQEKGIIADVDKPTDWVNNLVIVEKKNGSLRLCLDPKPLNLAIRRERYIIPTPCDVQSRLAGKSIFTILDEKDGYWQVKLTDESSYLCTFSTPWGRKRFLRMPFGISSASEVMQKRNEETFGDIHGVSIISDDMIIAAADDDEHDKILRKVLQRARERGVKFNKSKIQYKIKEVMYMGHRVCADGLKPDNKKIEAVIKMPCPEDKKGLQRLLGLVNYLASYIPNESTITAPLRALLKQDSQWCWESEHEQALDKLKEILTSKPVLQFYDVTKDVTIQADSSQYGLGAALMQDKRPVAYASRALTPTEENYAQIEKEMLAICFACQKFHQYIYGKSVNVQSDHRPLESIMRKPIAKAPPRLQRMMSRNIRTKLPCTTKMLKPNVAENSHQQLMTTKVKQQKYYNKGTKPLNRLKPGDVVRVRDQAKHWEPAVVLREHESPRSYIVNRHGREIRRNRRHLLLTNEPTPMIMNDASDEYSDLPSSSTAGPLSLARPATTSTTLDPASTTLDPASTTLDPASTTLDSQELVQQQATAGTRSRRQIVMPARYKNFIM